MRWGLFGTRPLLHWSRGGVVILGDAAHAMLPHHGQGANTTIEDAITLAELLPGTAPDGIGPMLAKYQSLRRARTLAGRQVDIYGSAAAFLENRALRPACLILDHHMPRMTGLELAARLRTEGMATPILLISGAVSPAIITHAARIGIDKVLGKPPAEDDLLTFVDAYC